MFLNKSETKVFKNTLVSVLFLWNIALKALLTIQVDMFLFKYSIFLSSEKRLLTRKGKIARALLIQLQNRLTTSSNTVFR